jgi:O-acetyl-ADP-ribose deacetylase (regulator of RNase III)
MFPAVARDVNQDSPIKGKFSYKQIKWRDKGIFDSKVQVLVNTVNCVGVMGKGLAKEFAEKYPDMYADYKQRCKKKSNNKLQEKLQTGKPYLYKHKDSVTKKEQWILNFPTKNDWRNGSKQEWIEAGLQYLVANARHWRIKSIAFPELGCGLGGLEWNNIYPLMKPYLEQLQANGIYVEVYSKNPEPAAQIIQANSVSPSSTSKSSVTKKRRLDVSTNVEFFSQPQEETSQIPQANSLSTSSPLNKTAGLKKRPASTEAKITDFFINKSSNKIARMPDELRKSPSKKH